MNPSSFCSSAGLSPSDVLAGCCWLGSACASAAVALGSELSRLCMGAAGMPVDADSAGARGAEGSAGLLKKMLMTGEG